MEFRAFDLVYPDSCQLFWRIVFFIVYREHAYRCVTTTFNFYLHDEAS